MLGIMVRHGRDRRVLLTLAARAAFTTSRVRHNNNKNDATAARAAFTRIYPFPSITDAVAKFPNKSCVVFLVFSSVETLLRRLFYWMEKKKKWKKILTVRFSFCITIKPNQTRNIGFINNFTSIQRVEVYFCGIYGIFTVNLFNNNMINNIYLLLKLYFQKFFLLSFTLSFFWTIQYFGKKPMYMKKVRLEFQKLFEMNFLAHI